MLWLDHNSGSEDKRKSRGQEKMTRRLLGSHDIVLDGFLEKLLLAIVPETMWEATGLLFKDV